MRCGPGRRRSARRVLALILAERPPEGRLPEVEDAAPRVPEPGAVLLLGARRGLGVRDAARRGSPAAQPHAPKRGSGANCGGSPHPCAKSSFLRPVSGTAPGGPLGTGAAGGGIPHCGRPDGAPGNRGLTVRRRRLDALARDVKYPRAWSQPDGTERGHRARSLSGSVAERVREQQALSPKNGTPPSRIRSKTQVVGPPAGSRGPSDFWASADGAHVARRRALRAAQRAHHLVGERVREPGLHLGELRDVRGASPGRRTRSPRAPCSDTARPGRAPARARARSASASASRGAARRADPCAAAPLPPSRRGIGPCAFLLPRSTAARMSRPKRRRISSVTPFISASSRVVRAGAAARPPSACGCRAP